MQAAKETEERGLRRYERGKEDVGGGIEAGAFKSPGRRRGMRSRISGGVGRNRGMERG